MVQDPDCHFIVEVDASNIGIGAVLSHCFSDGKINPCSFFLFLSYTPTSPFTVPFSLSYQTKDQTRIHFAVGQSDWLVLLLSVQLSNTQTVQFAICHVQYTYFEIQPNFCPHKEQENGQTSFSPGSKTYIHAHQHVCAIILFEVFLVSCINVYLLLMDLITTPEENRKVQVFKILSRVTVRTNNRKHRNLTKNTFPAIIDCNSKSKLCGVSCCLRGQSTQEIHKFQSLTKDI